LIEHDHVEHSEVGMCLIEWRGGAAELTIKYV
jgi:hypothetical protein